MIKFFCLSDFYRMSSCSDRGTVDIGIANDLNEFQSGKSNAMEHKAAPESFLSKPGVLAG